MLRVLPIACFLTLTACDVDDQTGEAAGRGMMTGMAAGAVVGAFNGDLGRSAVVGSFAGAAGGFVADQMSR